MSDPTAPLRVTDLVKEYPTGAPGGPLRVLDGLSLALDAGERVAILGPSGSGKSTLLNILGTLDAPTAGAVRLGEVDPFALTAPAAARFRAERIGFVFQEAHLLAQCTASENVLLASLARGRVARADVARAAELLERVGLADRAGHLPSQLSGGERQRVAVARALMNQPALLLADEPTGNLDAETAAGVGELLIELAQRSRAILIVATHSEALAAQVGRQRRLSSGRLIE